MNIISHKPSLETIVMPLVRMLSEADLSWADRATVTQAIAACQRHWKEMEDEKQMIQQSEHKMAVSSSPLSKYSGPYVTTTGSQANK